MTEQWRSVRVWSVSDIGRVMKDGILVTPYVINGHLYVYKPGGGHQGVHHLVLEAFVGPRPEGQEALHANDVPDDNRVSNLRWGTRSENVLDSVRNGSHPQASKTHCPRGHEYTSENTMISEHKTKGPYRRCRTCSRDECRRRRAA